MEVTCNKSGGIAGVRERLGPVDTAQQGDMGVRIEAKIEEIGFFAMPEELPGEPFPDCFNYSVTVDAGDRQHRVGYNDATEREDRRPLEELQQLLEDNGWTYQEVRREAERS